MDRTIAPLNTKIRGEKNNKPTPGGISTVNKVGEGKGRMFFSLMMLEIAQGVGSRPRNAKGETGESRPKKRDHNGDTAAPN